MTDPTFPDVFNGRGGGKQQSHASTDLTLEAKRMRWTGTSPVSIHSKARVKPTVDDGAPSPASLNGRRSEKRLEPETDLTLET